MWKGLHSVDLSYNALGSIGIAHCAPLLQRQRRLEELRLVESGLAAESARLVKGFLCQGPTTHLRVLHLHANRVESAGVVYFAEVVEKSPELESLGLSSLGARAPALAAVTSALKGKTNMRELDLSDNLLDVPAAQVLADVIVTLPKLDRLVLRDLDMGDDALTALLGPLADAEPKPPLVELALAGNELSPDAAPAIATVVSAFAALLQVLDLSRNELGETGAQSIADALADVRKVEERVTLAQLLLAGNEIPALPIVRLAVQLMAIDGGLEWMCFHGHNHIYHDTKLAMLLFVAGVHCSSDVHLSRLSTGAIISPIRFSGRNLGTFAALSQIPHQNRFIALRYKSFQNCGDAEADCIVASRNGRS